MFWKTVGCNDGDKTASFKETVGSGPSTSALPGDIYAGVKEPITLSFPDDKGWCQVFSYFRKTKFL